MLGGVLAKLLEGAGFTEAVIANTPFIYGLVHPFGPRSVLGLMGMHDLFWNQDLYQRGIYPYAMSVDDYFRDRHSSFPAGTAPLAIAYDHVCTLMGMKLLQYTPIIPESEQVLFNHGIVKSDKIPYHKGVHFLAPSRPARNINHCKNACERVCAFGHYFVVKQSPFATILQSPISEKAAQRHIDLKVEAESLHAALQAYMLSPENLPVIFGRRQITNEEESHEQHSVHVAQKEKYLNGNFEAHELPHVTYSQFPHRIDALREELEREPTPGEIAADQMVQANEEISRLEARYAVRLDKYTDEEIDAAALADSREETKENPADEGNLAGDGVVVPTLGARVTPPTQRRGQPAARQ